MPTPETREQTPNDDQATGDLLRAAAFGVGIAVLAALCVAISRHPNNIATLWFPNAAAAMFLATIAPRRWPVFLAAFVIALVSVNALLLDGFIWIAGLVTANLVETILMSALIRQFGGFRAPRPHDAFRLVLLAGGPLPVLAGATISAFVTSTVLAVPFAPAWWSWAYGNALGFMGVASAALIIARIGLSGFLKRLQNPRELTIMCIAVALIWFCTRLPYPLVYVSLVLSVTAVLTRAAPATVALILTSIIMQLRMHTGVLTDPTALSHGTGAGLYGPMLLTFVPALFIAATRAKLFLALQNAEAGRSHTLARFESVISSMPLLTLIRTVDGQALFASKATLDYIGAPDIQSMQLARDTVVHPDDLEKYVAMGTPEKSAQAGQFQLEVRLRRHDGVYRWFNVHNYPVMGPDNTVIERAAVAHDIDDLKTLLAQTIELNRSNEALEIFALAASHDLQEPLRMITSYTALLEKNYGDELGEDGREMIGYAKNGAINMKQLIDDLLAYSRISIPDESAQGSVGAAVNSARMMLFKLLADTGAQINEHPAIPDVRVDQASLQRLFTNLIENAIHYVDDKVPHIDIRCRDITDGMATIAVRDNGIGVPEESQQLIFEIFKRPNRRRRAAYARPGTGVGLAMCRRIAESSGGRIWVESDGDSGSTFYFTLPVAEEQPEPVHAPAGETTETEEATI